jgi:hypothetical protein
MPQLHEPTATPMPLAPSAVVSHQSFETPVAQVCHHSGRYLTAGETNPKKGTLFYEQHDFPGHPDLDKLFFQQAAHAAQHQHFTYNRPAIHGVGMLVTGVVLLTGWLALLSRFDQWATPLEYAFGMLLLTLASVGGLALIGYGAYQISQRFALYHRSAIGKPPALTDLPLLASYKIDAMERLTVAMELGLGTGQPDTTLHEPTITDQDCTLRVELIPDEQMQALYTTYQERYGAAGYGEYLHGGTVALEHAHRVAMSPPLEYGHRLVLRQPVAQQFASGQQYSGKPVRFERSYQLKSEVFEGEEGDLLLFPLEIQPEIRLDDSYTLLIHFRWHGDPTLQPFLTQCRITLPPDLGSVVRVSWGRVLDDIEVLWRGLPFKEHTLTLSVTFAEAILKAQPVIEGEYTVTLDGLLSGLLIRRDRIWNAMGVPINGDARLSVRRKSTIAGPLRIHTVHLSQEHEHVVDGEDLVVLYEPDHALLRLLTQVLVAEGVSLQRIERPLQRLAPEGRLGLQLTYWDIVGRSYEEVNLNALDVHVVVAGRRLVQGPLGSAGIKTPAGLSPTDQPTRIDVRVRCLHDPRNQVPVARAHALCNNIVRAMGSAIDAQRLNVLTTSVSVAADGMEQG